MVSEKSVQSLPLNNSHQPLAPHTVLPDFYSAPTERAQVVNKMFDRSARYYDRISGVLSMGSDRFYRKFVLRRSGLRPGMKLLDVATGTGLVLRGALDLGLKP